MRWDVKGEKKEIGLDNWKDRKPEREFIRVSAGL